MYAALTVSIWPAKAFALELDAADVRESYVAAAKNGLFSVLMCHGFGPILAIRVKLSGFVVREANASYAAFYQVAKEATEQAIGVAESAEFNVSW